LKTTKFAENYLRKFPNEAGNSERLIHKELLIDEELHTIE